MHIIERLFDGDKTGTESKIIDLRDHVSMSLQIRGLTGGTTAILYGTLFENGYNFLPVKLDGSTVISSDGMYVVPPYFRYYKLVLQRVGSSPIKAYFYAVKQGAFLQLSPQQSIASNGEFDLIRLGGQYDLTVDQPLTTTMAQTSIATISGALELYISHIMFSVKGQGGGLIEVEKQVGAVYEKIYEYSLNGFQPTIVDPIYFLNKIEHGTSNVTIRIKAKRFLYQFPSFVFGRITMLTK